MNLDRREERSSVDDGCFRTDSSCCASSQSPHTHMNMSLIKWTEFLSQYCCSPTWSNMGGFLPKPVSKVSWTEVFNSGVGRGNSSHIRSQQRHCKDIRHPDRAGKRKERSRRERESHHIKQENYFPLALNSQRKRGPQHIIHNIKYLTGTCSCRSTSCFTFLDFKKGLWLGLKRNQRFKPWARKKRVQSIHGFKNKNFRQHRLNSRYSFLKFWKLQAGGWGFH